MCKIFIAIALLIVIVSCETELDYQPKDSPASFVLYSFLENDSIFSFHVSKTGAVNSYSDSYLADDGIVSVYENNIIVYEIPYYAVSSWVAIPSVIINHSNDYRITYKSPNSPLLSAETTIPKPTAILEVDTISYPQSLSSQYDTLVNCEIVFKDSIKVKNYYQLVVSSYTLKDGEFIWQKNNVDFVKSDELFFTSIEIVGGLGNGIDFGGLFTDSSIDGKSYRLKCQVPKEMFYMKKGEAKKRVEFELYTLSYEYYQYYKSRMFIEGYSGVPFLNPVISYSNVSNGLGCVSGLSSSDYSLEAK